MAVATRSDAISLLRGEPVARPQIDRNLAGGLQAWLNDELYALFGNDHPTSIRLTPWSTVHPETKSGMFSSARAALVCALFTQRVLGGEINHAMDDALCVLEADPTAKDLVHEIHHLDADRFALLAAEIEAHDFILSQHLRAVPGCWLPRFGVRSSCALHGGLLTLATTTDLMLGAPPLGSASVALLDVTAAAHDESITQQLQVRSLIETLRTSTQPFAVGSLSSATGDCVVLPVQESDLVSAIHLVIDAAKRTLSD